MISQSQAAQSGGAAKSEQTQAQRSKRSWLLGATIVLSFGALGTWSLARNQPASANSQTPAASTVQETAPCPPDSLPENGVCIPLEQAQPEQSH